MANALFLTTVHAIAPFVDWIDSLGVQLPGGATVYELALFIVAVGFGFWVMRSMGAGLLTWLLFTMIFYVFLVGIGLGVVQ